MKTPKSRYREINVIRYSTWATPETPVARQKMKPVIRGTLEQAYPLAVGYYASTSVRSSVVKLNVRRSPDK